MIFFPQITYGLFLNRTQEYIHIHTNIICYLMTQYSMKTRIEKYKDKGEEDESK